MFGHFVSKMFGLSEIRFVFRDGLGVHVEEDLNYAQRLETILPK